MTGICIDDLTLAEDAGEQSEIVNNFSDLRKSCQSHIIFWHLARLPSGKIVNRQNITDRAGRLMSTYDKIHTFSYAGETNYIAQGEKPCITKIEGVTVGSAICYDLRFSELYNHYRQRTTMLINTTNWPSTRTEQGLCLLQARATENRYFVVGVNRIGTDGQGLNYLRSSAVLSPLGERLNTMCQVAFWDVYEINLDDVIAIRNNFPFVLYRGESLYEKWLEMSTHKKVN